MDKELKLTQEAIETYEAPQIEVIDIEVEENIMQASPGSGGSGTPPTGDGVVW